MNKQATLNILGFIILMVALDIVGGRILEKKFSDINFGIYGEINASLNSDDEILILGSSRARHHYNPKIIANTLEKSCYNSGLGGQGLFYNYAILKERIQRKKPEMVILDVSPNVIVDNESYSKLNILLPYYKKYDAFQEIVKLDPEFSPIKLISNLFLYNSTLYDLIRSKKGKPLVFDKGFEPLTGEMNPNSFKPYHLTNEKFDIEKIKIFKKITSLCKENDVELIIIISPTYLKFDKDNRIIDQIAEILEEEKINLYDYSDFQETYGQSRYFTDQLHLNELGSTLFTRDLAEEINQK